MKKRNIALCVILSIITFGIYGIYWFIKINNDSSCSRSLRSAFTASTGHIKWANSWIRRLSSAVCRQRTAPYST